MGYKLYREVLDHAPADLTPAERLVLAVLADFARDDTRQAWPGIEWLAHRCGMTARGVRNALARLAARGYEVRVAFGKDKNGRPVYSHHGRRTSYLVPSFPPRTLPHAEPVDNSTKGGTTVPPSDSERRHESDPKAARERHEGGTTVPPLDSANPHEPSAAADDPNVRIVTRATGCTPEHAAAAIELICKEKDPDNLGGFLTHLARAHELGEWLTRAATGARPPNRTDRKVLQALAIAERLQAEQDAIDGEVVDPCPHGTPTGPRHCALCRIGAP